MDETTMFCIGTIISVIMVGILLFFFNNSIKADKRREERLKECKDLRSKMLQQVYRIDQTDLGGGLAYIDKLWKVYDYATTDDKLDSTQHIKTLYSDVDWKFLTGENK